MTRHFDRRVAGRMVPAPFVWLVGWLTLFGMLPAAQNASAAEGVVPEQHGDLVGHLEDWLREQAGSQAEQVAPDVKELSELVELDADGLSYRQGELTWTVRRKRKLTAVERARALELLEEVLVRVLSQEPAGDKPPSMTRQQAFDQVTTRSTLAIARQPSLATLSTQQIIQAVSRFWERGLSEEQQTGIDELQADYRVAPEDVRLLGGRIIWPVTVLPGREDIAGPPDERLLRSVVVDALGAPAPELGIPLLDAEDLALLRRENSGLARGPGEPAFPRRRVRAPRTIARIRPADDWKPREPRREPSILDADAPQDTTVRRLVLDTGGFTGGFVNGLAFSPDGKLLAAGGDVVRIWDLETGELRHTLRGQQEFGGAGACTDLTFSPDGRQLLVSVAGFEDSLRVYRLAELPEISEVYGGHWGHIERLAISHDGKWLITAGADRIVNYWDWSKQRVMAAYQSARSIDYVGFPTATSSALVVDEQGNYDYRRVDTMQPADADDRNVLENFWTAQPQWPHGGQPHPFSLDARLGAGGWLVGGLGKEGVAHRYWCAFWPDGQRAPAAVHQHRYYVTCCAISPDGKWAASADAEGDIHVWSTEQRNNNQLVRWRFASGHAPIYALDYNAADGRLVFGRRPYQPPAWKPNCYGPLTEVMDLRSRTTSEQPPAPPPAPALVRNGERLLHRVGYLALLDRRGTELARLPYPDSHKWFPNTFSFVHRQAIDFRHVVAVGTQDGGLFCLRPDNLLSVRTFLGHADRVWCLRQSDDGRFLASGSGDGTIRIWRLDEIDAARRGNLAASADDDGRIYHVVPGTPTAAAGLRVGDTLQEINGRTLASLGQEFAATGAWPLAPEQAVPVTYRRDGQELRVRVQLSDVGDVREPVYSIFLSPDRRDWVIWTPQGYYDASPGGDRLVGWHVNRGQTKPADFYPLDQFSNFYRPDVIDHLLDTGDLERALELAQQDGPPLPASAPGSLDATDPVRPPKIEILEPAPETMTSTPQVTVRGHVIAHPAAPRIEVQVLVNEIGIHERGVQVIAHAPDGQVHGFSRELALQAGRNQIRVVAYNGAANASSETVVVTYREANAPPTERRLFVIAVGISDYQDPRFRLRFAHRDAEAFAEACRLQQGGLYSQVETRLVLDDQATREGLDEAFLWLIDRANQPSDVAILFLSAHGVIDERQNYFLACHELDADQIRRTCLRWTAVQDLAQDLPCMFLVLADTCHSGGIDSLKELRFDPLRDLERGNMGTIVLASCERRLRSYEHDKWQHGLFTRALLDTLGAQPAGAALSVGELWVQLDLRAQKLGDEIGKPQRPVLYSSQALKNLELFQGR